MVLLGDGNRYIVIDRTPWNGRVGERWRVYDTNWLELESHTIGPSNPGGVVAVNNRIYLAAPGEVQIYTKNFQWLNTVKITGNNRSNTNIGGIASDGYYIYVTFERTTNNKIYRYDMDMTTREEITLTDLPNEYRVGMTTYNNSLCVLIDRTVNSNRKYEIWLYDILTGSGQLKGIELDKDIVYSIQGNKIISYEPDGSKLEELTISNNIKPISMTILNDIKYILEKDRIIELGKTNKIINLNLIGDPIDITNDGTNLYVALGTTKTIYAYNNNGRVPSRDIQLDKISNITGISYADDLLHVSKSNLDIDHYKITTTTPNTDSGNTLTDITLHTDNNKPLGIATRNNIILVSDNNDKLYAYYGRGPNLGQRVTNYEYNFRTTNTDNIIPNKPQGMDIDWNQLYVANKADTTDNNHRIFFYLLRSNIQRILKNPFDINITRINKILRNPFRIEINTVDKILRNPFNISASNIDKVLRNIFTISSSKIDKVLRNPFNIATTRVNKIIRNPFNINNPLRKILRNPFNIPRVQIRKSLGNLFFILKTPRRQKALEFDLPSDIIDPYGLTFHDLNWYISDRNETIISNKVYKHIFATTLNGSLDSNKTINIDQSNPDTDLTNAQPTGLATINDILYCMDGTQFSPQIFSYSFDTNNQIGLSTLNQVENNDLLSLVGLSIDSDGKVYTASPQYLERQRDGSFEHKPTLWIYNSINDRDPSGQAIIIDQYVTGVSVNDKYVITISNNTAASQRYCTIYDKITKLPIDNRSFELDSNNNKPRGCHIIDDVLFVLDENHLYAYSINYEFIKVPLIISNSIGNYLISKTLQIINSIPIYQISVKLNIVNKIIKSLRIESRLEIINDINKYTIDANLDIINKITSGVISSRLKIVNTINDYRDRVKIKFINSKKRFNIDDC